MATIDYDVDFNVDEIASCLVEVYSGTYEIFECTTFKPNNNDNLIVTSVINMDREVASVCGFCTDGNETTEMVVISNSTTKRPVFFRFMIDKDKVYVCGKALK